MIICDKCGDALHQNCSNTIEIPKGLWFCAKCLESIRKGDERDVLYNETLREYLTRVQTEGNISSLNHQYT